MNDISNINTYLKNKQSPLSVAGYNEVDALILAQLSYYPFEWIFPGYEGLQIPVNEFAGEIMKSSDFAMAYSEDKKTFIARIAQSKRFAKCVIHHMRAVGNENSRWAAFTMDIGRTGVTVIAMRGTDRTAVGWAENFRLGYSTVGTGAQLAAFRYLKEATVSKIYLTGHSKGGNNVSSAYVMSNAYVRDKILRIDNFDGPGVNPEFAANYGDGYRALTSKLRNFYPEDSVIGLLLKDNPGESFFIRAKARGDYASNPIFGQHDPFAWVVEDEEFQKAKQSCISQKLNWVVDTLLEETNSAQRYQLVQFAEQIGIPAWFAGKKKRNTLHKENQKDIMKEIEFNTRNVKN